MPTTERQIESNRVNARLSTGPKTEAGKAASSQNSTRHALTARGLIIPAGHEQAFTDHEAGLRVSLRPATPLQEVIFARALESSWNLYRCRLAEAQLHSETGVDPLLDTDNSARYDRIRKYARQYELSMYKALRELGTLQTESEFRHEICPLTDSYPSTLEEFEQTPHASSEVCSFQKFRRRFQNEASRTLRRLLPDEII